MTEEEAKAALFKLHHDYMMNPPKIREQKYEEYRMAREKIKHELARAMFERKENEFQSKTK